MDYETADAIRRQILAENDPVTGGIVLGVKLANDPDFYDALHGREIAPGVHIQNPGPDPSQMTARYLEGVGNAGTRYVQGMQNPRRHPVEAAVRAKGKWAQKTTEAIQLGSYEKGVRQQNYAEAVQIATADGGTAYTSGAQRREGKVSRAFQRLAPLQGGLSQSIQNMPQDTEAQREARLIAARRGMIAIGKQMKSGGGG